MKRKTTSPEQSVSVLIKSAFNTLLKHPIILYPLSILAFIQFLILEILYFAPRWPLSKFFAPLVQKQWGEMFIHYPMYFRLLPKLFYSTQIPAYLFLGAFLSAIAISIIIMINQDKTIKLRLAFRQTAGLYVYIFLAAVLIFVTILPFVKLYEFAMIRAMQIRSEAGPFFWLKVFVVEGGPYFNLLFNIFVTTCYAFLLPIIVFERKKIHVALLENFRLIKTSLGVILGAVALLTFLYTPIVMLRTVARDLSQETPEILVFAISAGILVKLFIETMILTTTTTLYLIKKEK